MSGFWGMGAVVRGAGGSLGQASRDPSIFSARLTAEPKETTKSKVGDDMHKTPPRQTVPSLRVLIARGKAFDGEDRGEMIQLIEDMTEALEGLALSDVKALFASDGTLDIERGELECDPAASE